MGELKVGNLSNSVVAELSNLMVGKLKVGKLGKLVMGKMQETKVSLKPTASSLSATPQMSLKI